jgi:hypothetical protein
VASLAGKRKPKPKRRRQPPPAWLQEDGLRALLPGRPPDPQTLEAMTCRYQEQIRNSPVWDELVREFGAQRAEVLLRDFRVELG